MTYSNLLFVSVILPISVLFGMFDRSAEYKNLILCITSLLFVIWGRAFAVSFVFLSVVADFFLAIATEGSLKRNKQSAAVFMIVDFIWNAFLFIVLTRNSIFDADSRLHLRNALIPVGAAFYTLKNFSYVYDVYSERIKAERNIFCLFTYSMSYPFLLAGPVVRYGDIEPQIRNRSFDVKKLSTGLTRFALGLAKTVLVVPALTQLYEAGLSAEEPTLAGAWIGMIAFFGNAYFTFMGLSDMGAGIAMMNGFEVNVNYSPITSSHMLGGLISSYNTSMVNLFRDFIGTGTFAAILTAFTALLGTAFYAQKRFLFGFGVVIAILLALECLVSYETIEKIPSFIKLPITFVLSMLLFSGFAFDSMEQWESWLENLFGIDTLYTLSTSIKYAIMNNCWLLIIAFISVTPIGREIVSTFNAAGEKSPKSYNRMRIIKTLLTAVLLVASLLVLAASAE